MPALNLWLSDWLESRIQNPGDRVREAVFCVLASVFSILGRLMKVAIDLQSALMTRAGIGQYTYSLAKYLPRLSPSNEFIGLAFGRGGGDLADLEAPNFRVRRVSCIPRRAMNLLWKKIDWPPVDAFTGAVDLFHFPGFVARPLRNAKAVVTIHDLAFRRMPDFSEARNAAFLNKHVPLTLERAALVLVDSKFTASELSELYGYPGDKTRVIPLGVEEGFYPRPEEESYRLCRQYGLPERFILCVSTIEPRKNIGTLLEAYGLLREGGGEVPDLVIIGGRGWRGEDEKIERIIEKLKLRDAVKLLGYVERGAMPALYSAATLFVFPSLYEGFGLPPIEAMACGLPVICSNAPSLPEVVGDAALLVPPRDAACMAGEMRKLIDDAALRQELKQQGLARAKHFTWAETARLTLNAYREAVG
jgi:glycosyltransferase involved in cell wall biosynthesis